MAVPALPSDMSAGNVWTAARVNAIYDHLDFWRNDLPVFKIEGFAGNDGINGTITSGSLTEIEWSDGAGAFNETPAINNGGFTAGTGGKLGVIVPETGVYEVSVHADWASTDVDGRRQINAEKEGSDIAGSFSTIDACATSNTRHGSPPALVACTSGDEITAECFQNSGSALTATFTLQIKFLYAT